MTTPEMSYEAARTQLTEIVQKLESGGVELAETMKLWEEGERLAGICQQWLDGAQATLKAARENADGADT